MNDYPSVDLRKTNDLRACWILPCGLTVCADLRVGVDSARDQKKLEASALPPPIVIFNWGRCPKDGGGAHLS